MGVKRIVSLLVVGLVIGCASAPSARRGAVHVLRAGENLYRLSVYYEVPVAEIKRVNRIRDVSEIPVGARLLIPGTRKSPPRRNLRLASIAPVPDVAARPRLARELGLEFGWPLRGRLSSSFGWRGLRAHEGIDIVARSGTKVRAAEAGRVIESGWLGGYGRVVIVKHAGRYSSVYAHNSRNRVRKGQFVEKGQVVAEVGSSGRSSGPHLHFEIRRDRDPQDPLRYLR
jgi:murein DD-endopeptidase MepM/ murein hydrolase activator NlpD